MKTSKFFYLYLTGAVVALILAIYNIASSYPNYQAGSLTIELLMFIFFAYMANKTWHEKKDKEMM